jgi:serine/threonine-protein kinase
VGSIDNGGAQFSFSQTGTLIHMTGDTPESKPISVVWMDREGRAEPLLKEPGFYLQPRFSPDGRRLALTIRDRGTGPPFGDIWIYEFERGTLMRLTFDGENIMPQWTADGAYVTYAARGKGTFRKRADGVGEAERLFSSDEDLVIPTWSSPDGKAMVAIAAVGSAKGAFPRDLNVSLVRQDGARSAGASSVEPVLSGPFVETWPTISPDGRWMAYVSTESGREQVYVSPAPRPGRSSSAGRWQVSIEGGSYPQWSPSGRELFYVDRGGMMAVTYSASGESFVAGKPQQLFQPGFLNMDTYTYDVAPDGKRFAILAAARNEQPAEVHPTMVLNWFDEVRRLVPPVR